MRWFSMLVLLLVPLVGRARTLDEAKQHFQTGIANVGRGDFQAALDEFEASYQLNPTPEVLVNIALSQKALGHFSDAIDALDRYLAGDFAHPRTINEHRRAQVARLQAELKEKLATLELAVPSGAAVVIDGRRVGTGPASGLKLDPGVHHLEATADGFEPARKELSLAAGERASLALELEPVHRTPPPAAVVTPSGAALAPPRVDVPTRTDAPPPFLRTVRGRTTVAAATTAAALLLASAVTGAAALAARSDYHTSCDATCNDALYGRARGLAVSTDVLLGVAGAAAVATLVLVLTRPKHHTAVASGSSHGAALARGRW